MHLVSQSEAGAILLKPFIDRVTPYPLSHMHTYSNTHTHTHTHTHTPPQPLHTPNMVYYDTGGHHIGKDKDSITILIVALSSLSLFTVIAGDEKRYSPRFYQHTWRAYNVDNSLLTSINRHLHSGTGHDFGIGSFLVPICCHFVFRVVLLNQWF